MNKPNDSFKPLRYGVFFGCGVVFTLIIMLLILWICNKCFLANSWIITTDKMSIHEYISIQTLLANHKIISASDILSHLTSFYSVVISLLIGVLGLSGLFGYIHIKQLSIEKLHEHKEKVKGEAKDEAIKEVSKYLKSYEFYNAIGGHVTATLNANDILQKLEYLENQVEKYINSPNTVNIEEIPEKKPAAKSTSRKTTKGRK